MAVSKPTIEPLPRKRILAIAYACNPYRGSEHGVGWGWLGMIANNHEVWCLACQTDQAEIEQYCSQYPDSDYSKVNFVYIEHSWNQTLNKIWPPYYLWRFRRQWQRGAYEAAKRLHAQHAFDLCHLITYVGFRIPGEFYKLDCPFIWGPIGGLENTPWHLLPSMGFKGAVHFGMRNIANSLQKRFLTAPKEAFSKAAKTRSIIAATTSIQLEIKEWYGVESHVICEIGPPPVSKPISVSHRLPGEPLQISWSGLHQPRKALPLLLKSLKKLPRSVRWKLNVLGDGPCYSKWVKQAERLGLNDRICWHGRKDRAEAIAVMQESHLFVITSLYDLTSTVLIEALSLGVPVIAPDHYGFSDVLTEGCGIKIPIPRVSFFTSGLARQIMAIHNDEPRRKELAAGAIKRVKNYAWVKKNESLKDYYRVALHSSET